MSLPEHVTTEELASVLDLSGRRVRQLADDDVLPKSDRNQFNLRQSLKAFWAHKEAEIRAEFCDSESSNANYEKERARLTKAKADKAEIEADLLGGTVHDSEVIASVMNEMLSNARAKFLALPTIAAPKVADITELNAVKAILTDAVYEILTELSAYPADEIVARQLNRTPPDDEEEMSEPAPNE